MQHYQASGLKEHRRLTAGFYTMKIELGEQPWKFLLRVDQMVKELERGDRPVDRKDIDIVILSVLTAQYDAEVRMLESSSDWPTREWIKRAAINQYERLECEKSTAGSRAMLPAPTAISVLDLKKPSNAQTLSLGRSSPQALARLWPHAAPRASGIKMGTGWQTAVLPKL